MSGPTFGVTPKLPALLVGAAPITVSKSGLSYTIGYSGYAPPSTVAGLPSSPSKGDRAFVTDATAATFWTIVVGGGANNVPVTYDGTNWRIG